jgi:TRAP-type C4-dicarboxylate transport system permease small subunit
MFYEVLMRYVFDAPTLWVEELSRWLGGVVFLMSGLYAMQQRSHIRVTIIYDIASRKVQKLFDVISTACILIFAYAVTIGYWKNALTKFSTWELYGSAWNPPIPAIMKPLIVLTLIWMAVQAMNNLIMDWSKTAQIHDSANDTL